MLKPFWFDKKIDFKNIDRINILLREFSLYTVCQEARCPNISECFQKGIVTFLILGDVCTRNCLFCGIKKGRPRPVDEEEPLKIARVVKRLNLKYVVITSVTRDDLEDKGVSQFIRTMEHIRRLNGEVSIELLIPDFSQKENLLKRIVEKKPQVIAHNLETIKRFYPYLRDRADYERSLNVLKMVKLYDRTIFTKSGIILGLGERKGEVLKLLSDLRKVDCDFLTLGQYLPPSRKHIFPEEYVKPEVFLFYKKMAERLGFKKVKAGPYIRSSKLSLLM